MFSEFLLNTQRAKELYNSVEDLPIVDYHNHLSFDDIRANKRYFDVYDLWIAPDPYKHRAMRMCGVDEKYITGDATSKEKFIKWIDTIPKLIGNPLYIWSLMELNIIFNIDKVPDNRNAKKIYESCNEYLKDNIISVNSLLDKFNVEFACPCASLIEDISFLKNSTRLSPSLRGDDIVNPSKQFINELEKLTYIKISNLNNFENAIKKRLKYFKSCGCVFTDHALDNGFKFYNEDDKNDERFISLLNNNITASELEKLSSHILLFLSQEYAKIGFVMQLHIGAERYTSSVLREKVGPVGGFACIGNSVNVDSLTKFLDAVDMCKYGLPKTVLFTLNPSDNALISVLSGSYHKDGVKGIITQGPAWWWCDHKKGIEDMLENASAFSVLSNFIGMTTDSRSFLSFVRHDYFRRILCSWVAEKLDKNEFLCSNEQIKDLLLKLCYKNAKEILK